MTVIRPSRGWRSLGLQELWEYRELLIFLAWREVIGSYRQTAFGKAWLFLRPVINIAVLSLTFGMVVKVDSDGVYYPLFAAAALIPWLYFTTAVQRSAASLVGNMHMISKVYFPRLVLPIAGVLSGIADLAASLIVFFVLLFARGLPVRAAMIWIPVFMLCALMVALAFGLWSASLSVRYRDVAIAMSFLLQALMYGSPVIYSIEAVPEAVRPIYLLNPMTGVIHGMRWSLLGSNGPPGSWFVLSMVITAIAVISGAYVFRRTERNLVDLL